MKKTSIIISSLCVCIVLIFAIGSTSFAWFASRNTINTDIIISSSRPLGQASIDNETDNVTGSFQPAIIKPGYMGGYFGDNLPNISYDSLDVLDTSLVDRDNLYSNKPLLSNATQVSILFSFSYVGIPDYGFDDKRIKLVFNSITLKNPYEVFPEEHPNSGDIVNTNLINYNFEQFSSKIDIVHASLENNKYIVDTSKGDNGVRTDIKWEEVAVAKTTQISMNLLPTIKYFCRVMVNLNKVDEECDPMLINRKLHFNFEIEAINR